METEVFDSENCHSMERSSANAGVCKEGSVPALWQLRAAPGRKEKEERNLLFYDLPGSLTW